MPDASSPPPNEFTPDTQIKVAQSFTDGREKGDWKSHFPDEARREIKFEAWVLGGLLVLALGAAGISLGLTNADQCSVPIGPLNISISFRLLAIFFTGCVGGITFSIKWLIHTVAKEKWHLDRRYWRLLTPAIGGVYACVVLTLGNVQLLGTEVKADTSGVASSAALAFLVGYFSDGVSGLLSNVANAVFGTLEKK